MGSGSGGWWGAVFLWKAMREKGKGVGRGGDRQRNRQVNTQALSKPPCSDLPFLPDSTRRVGVEKFIPSLESLFTLGPREGTWDVPQEFAGVQKVSAKSSCSFFGPAPTDVGLAPNCPLEGPPPQNKFDDTSLKPQPFPPHPPPSLFWRGGGVLASLQAALGVRPTSGGTHEVLEGICKSDFAVKISTSGVYSDSIVSVF